MFLTAFGAIIWQICILHHGSGYPHNPNSNESVDSLIQTQLIDLQNPETQNLLRRFNVSADKIKFNRWSPRAETDSATLSGNDSFSDIKQLRFHDIKIKINNVMHGEPIADGNLPTHEMVAFPICTQVNTTTWKDDTNLTIRFAPSLFETVRHHMYLDKAVLRLFKVNPYSETEVTPRPACDENPLQNQIRVTISTIQYTRRNKREKKKRICNTLMLNTTRTGWIDIDIKKAIYIWEKSEHTTQTLYSSTGSNSRLQVMSGWLSIDVHDEDERQLNAGLYFEPPKCEEFRQYHGTFTDNLSLHLQWKRCSGSEPTPESVASDSEDTEIAQPLQQEGINKLRLTGYTPFGCNAPILDQPTNPNQPQPSQEKSPAETDNTTIMTMLVKMRAEFNTILDSVNRRLNRIENAVIETTRETPANFHFKH